MGALEAQLKTWFQGETPPRVPMFSTSGHSMIEYRGIIEGSVWRPYFSLGGKKDIVNAQWQPAALADVFPHETAIGWFKKLIRPNQEYGCAEHNEGIGSFKRRAGQACAHIIREYSVMDLCKSYPRRIQQVHDKGGDRLKH